MSSPTVNLSKIKAVGNIFTAQGAVDFGTTTGSSVFYLDPQPSGTSLGPFPVIAGGADLLSNLKLGSGHWKIRVVAAPDDGSPATTVSSPEVVVNRCQALLSAPLVGGGAAPPVVNSQMVVLDRDTQTAYHNAVTGAATGSKRLAGANALIAAFGTQQLLEIFMNGKKVVRCEYTGAMSLVNDGTTIRLHTGTPVPSKILAMGDLSAGKAYFVFQGGVNYSAQIWGEVGPLASGKMLTLSDNPIMGYDFSSEFDFLLPTAIDAQ